MKEADSHMWPGNSAGGYRFCARCLQPKWISLDIPGNACDLSPSSMNDGDVKRGFKLDPHNCDSTLQQLTFLVGLFALYDLVWNSLS